MIISALTFNWDINLGSILTGVSILVAVWKIHDASKKESMKMHEENRAEIKVIRESLQLVVTWMQSQWNRYGRQ